MRQVIPGAARIEPQEKISNRTDGNQQRLFSGARGAPTYSETEERSVIRRIVVSLAETLGTWEELTPSLIESRRAVMTRHNPYRGA